MNLLFKLLLSVSIALYLFNYPLYAMHQEEEDESSKASTPRVSTALIPLSDCRALARPLLTPMELLRASIVPNRMANSASAPHTQTPSMRSSQQLSVRSLTDPDEDDEWEDNWQYGPGVDEKAQPPVFRSPALGGRDAPIQRGALDFRLGKFKLGYEFQEISGLCPWALQNYNLQKNPLFALKMRSSDRTLWEVVIDTSDIEFVAKPFAYNERDLLQQCIDTVLRSLNVLQVLFDGYSEVQFSSWAEAIAKDINDTPHSLSYQKSFGLVAQNKLVRPSFPWRPRFSPQATIQHRLECTIPLYFALFGFSSPYMPSFSASLPLRDQFLEAHKHADSDLFENFLKGFQQKINGLVFLHALTLVQMAPDGDITDADLLKETYQSLTQSHQVDAKMKLLLMSRRPFSSMFRDIVTDPQEANYPAYFQKVMVKRGMNSGFFQVPTQFDRANYAEQFFDPATGAERTLVSFLPLFRPDFAADNLPMLEYLLKRGVISTTMLRNFKDDVVLYDADGKPQKVSVVSAFRDKAHFTAALGTVQQPTFRLTVDRAHPRVNLVRWRCDVLSPPSFLDDDNSMGGFKEDLTAREREYGEAIVEVRGIRNVQPWFLKKCGLDPEIEGEFLKNPSIDGGWREIYNVLNPLSFSDSVIINILGYFREPNPAFREEAMSLFDFLNSFGKDHRHIKEVYYLGMPAGLKY